MTEAQERPRGVGGGLLGWLVDYAQTHGYAAVHLDGSVRHAETHCFCPRERMAVEALPCVVPLLTALSIRT
jgi:hypothetical protein